jgi:hypothetical protein
MCSKSQPKDDPIGLKYIALRILYKVVSDGYLFNPDFNVQHNGQHNLKKIILMLYSYTPQVICPHIIHCFII